MGLWMRTARYQMSSARASLANAAANLRYQRAIAQAIQNARKQEPPIRRRSGVQQRAPRPAPPPDATALVLLPVDQLLTAEGAVRWPASAPADRAFSRARAAAESAIRIAVKEYESDGRTSAQCVDEAKNLLLAYGKPALERVALTSRSEAERLLKFFTSLEEALNDLARG